MGFCSYCKVEHALTKDNWYRLESSPRCKLQVKNKQKVRQTTDAYREYQADYRASHKEERTLAHKEWTSKNAEYHRGQALLWYYANKDRVRTIRRGYFKEREQKDPSFKLARRLRSRLYHALSGKTKKASHVEDLGCSVEGLRNYLATKFRDGMTWDNYGTVWEVDHIRPLARYDLTDRSVLLELVHFTNLQPLLIEENRKKGSKIHGF